MDGLKITGVMMMSIEAMKRAKDVMANARDWFGNDPHHRWDEDEVYHELVDAVVDLCKTIAEAEKQVSYSGNGTAGRENMTAPTGFFFQMPNAEQEPVAWMQSDEVHISLWKDDYHTIPLYTHPQPKREPLTDEQIEDGWEKITGHSIFGGNRTEGRTMYLSPDEVIEFARAIEAAHGIKGDA